MIFNRGAGLELAEEVKNHAESVRGDRLAADLYNQMNALHSKDYFTNKEVEELLWRQQRHEIDTEDYFKENNVYDIYFSPSSASKCKRELYYKAKKEKKDKSNLFPYHRRWTINASGVHACRQKDLLMAEKVLKEELNFKVKRLENGLPAWERNIARFHEITHDGVTFHLYGMCDGILTYLKDHSDVLFEFKTKSSGGAASVGNYKLKGVQEEHKQQATAYSLMFGIDEAVFMYESLTKDGWAKGKEAKNDIRTFYHKVTDEDKQALLDKFADVTRKFRANELPDKELDKCFFCQYRSHCEKDN